MIHIPKKSTKATKKRSYKPRIIIHSIKKMNVRSSVSRTGNSKISKKGNYVRSDTGKTAHYSAVRDLKIKASHRSSKHKANSGDSKRVTYSIGTKGKKRVGYL